MKLTPKQTQALQSAADDGGRIFQLPENRRFAPVLLSGLVKAGLLQLAPVGVVWTLTDAGRAALQAQADATAAPTGPTFKKVAGSNRNFHSSVLVDGAKIGEVWREQAHVTVSKLTEPRRTAKKWRWFAQMEGASQTLGRGTRSALLFGAGFSSRAAALAALTAQIEEARAAKTLEGGAQ